jgi:hypothetical protein
MRAKRRVLAILCVGGALWLFGVASASAQTQTFQGFTLKAVSSGTTVTFNQPGSPIPADPTGEMHEAYSEARQESGPTGHSVSSVLWPGSTAANAGSFFGFPNYPVRSEAFFPQGPADHVSNDGGTLTMKTHSDDSKSEASTTTQSVPGGPVGLIGSLTSTATTTVESAQVVAAATAAANDINLLNGVIHIGSVATDAKAITDGTLGTVEGQTLVTGTTINGVPVTVDQAGIHASTTTIPFAPNPAQSTLDALGVTIRVAQPVDTVNGADAARTAGGLEVTFAPGTAGLPTNVTTTYRFAGVSVSSAAIPPVAATTGGGGGAAPGSAAKTGGTGTGGGTSGAPATGGTSGSGSGTTTTTIPGTPPTAGSTVPAQEIVTTQPVAALPIPAAAAIPAALGGVAVAVSAVGGRLLTGLARGALSAEGTGAACPLGKE